LVSVHYESFTISFITPKHKGIYACLNFNRLSTAFFDGF
jgi:hypothetical protein